ncbi:MAG: DNA gyrase inhibitor YacG [Nitrospiria bacterium]
MKTIPCPICHKDVEWEGSPFHPFCSERCKLIDLGHWASGSYRIPADQEEREEEAPNSSDDGSDTDGPSGNHG